MFDKITFLKQFPPGKKTPWRHCNNVSLSIPVTSQNASKETPHDVSMERHQGVSVVRLHNILQERRDNFSRGCNNDVSSVRLHDVPNKSQMKHPMTGHWYTTQISQWYVSTMSHQYVLITSPVSPNRNTHQRRCGTSPPRLRVMLLQRLVSRSLLCFQVTLS